jgi:hypothetical protein
MPRSHQAAVRSVRDRVVRAQRAYAVRLREALVALRPLLDEGDAGAVDLAQAIEAELSHITHGSAIVE